MLSPNYDQKNVRFSTPTSSTASTSLPLSPSMSLSSSLPPSVPLSGHLSGSLKNEIEEKQKLEKDNFDLKLKVYHLEETLKHVAMNPSTTTEEMEDLQRENYQLRERLHESAVDLEQRNTLLVKAKGAIEALKNEMERMRSQLEMKTHIAHDSVNEGESHRKKIDKLEEENHHLTVTLKEKSDSLHDTRLKLNDLESSYSVLQLSFSELTGQRDNMTGRLQRVEEELHTARQERDSDRIRVVECGEMVEVLQEENEVLRIELKRLMEDEERRRETLREKYETYLTQLQSTHEKEIDDVKQKSAAALSTLKEQMRTAHHEEVTELRSQGFGENYRMKEELLTRVHEKAEEVISLRGLVDVERSKVESLTRDLSLSREEHKQTSLQYQECHRRLLDAENTIASKEEALTTSSATIHSLKEELLTLSHTHQHLQGALTSLRDEYRERGSELAHLQQIISKWTEEREHYSSLSEGLEEVIRQNEKLKHEVKDFENSRATHQLQQSHWEKTQQSLERELKERVRERETLQERCDRQEEKVSLLQNKLEELEEEKRKEDQERVALERAFEEQKAVVTTLQHAIEKEREVHRSEERKVVEEGHRTTNGHTEVYRSCRVMLQAVWKWDQLLTKTMDSFSLSPSPCSLSLAHSHPFPPFSSSHLSGSHLSSFPSPDPSEIVSQLLDHPENLLSSSISVVERCQTKMDRIERIRSLFERSVNEQLAAVNSAHQQALERLEGMKLKVSSLSLSLSQIKKEFQNEKKNRYENEEEMKHLKESILSSHTLQLSEQTGRYTELLSLYQTEKSATQRLDHELNVYREEVRLLREEVERLHELELKMREVTHHLSGLEREIEIKRKEVEECREERRERQKEKEEKEKERERLFQQDQLIEKLKTEIQHLQQRQMAPEVERTILESHELLKGSLRGERVKEREREREVDRESSFSHPLFDRSLSLYHLTRQLVDETADILRTYESSLPSSRSFAYSLPLSHSAGGSADLSNSLHDLLSANAKLSLQLHQHISDFQRHVLSEKAAPPISLDRSNPIASLSPYPSSSRSFSPPHKTQTPLVRFDVQPSQSSFPSQFLAPSASASLSQSQSQSYPYPLTPATPVGLKVSDLHFDSQPATPLHLSAPFSTRLTDRDRESKSGHSSRLEKDREREKERDRETSQRYPTRSTSLSRHQEREDWGERSRPLFEPYSSSTSSVPLSRFSSTVITTSSPSAARESATRLSKLGKELQSLANRLDTFETTSRR